MSTHCEEKPFHIGFVFGVNGETDTNGDGYPVGELYASSYSVTQGCSYDNNLLCIAEKEVFVVDRVFDAMLNAMEQAGAVRLNSQEIDKGIEFCHMIS